MTMEQENRFMLLDSLPYYDKEFENHSMRKRVQTLIDIEKKGMKFEESEYLKNTQSYGTSEKKSWEKRSHPFLNELYQRISTGDYMTDKKMYEPERYEVGEIHGKVDVDMGEWMKLQKDQRKKYLDDIRKMRIMLENLDIQQINLQLLKEKGKKKWTEDNLMFKKIEQILKERNDDVVNRTTNINKKRKFLQMEAGSKLDKLKYEISQTNKDLNSVKKECSRLKKKRKIDE